MLLLSLTLLLIQDPGDVTAAVADICARSDGLATSTEIGTSRGGRPILALTVRSPDMAADGPAVLVVAGVHGRHALGTDLALHHAAQLIDGYGEDAAATALLDRVVVHVVPQVNPDGAAMSRPGNARALDLDRDGVRDEDPADDLDGDGQIAQMRWADPEGEWIADPDEPRLMRKADRQQGERGTHCVAREGIDNDADGEREEDPADGVLLYRNFSHDFAAYDRSAGSVPMGEPEARALAAFVFGHRSIGMAFVYDIDDNLLAKPKVDEGKQRAPLTGILADDATLYEAVAARYRDKTGRASTPGSDRHDGSTWSWLYADAGIPTFATSVWAIADDAGADEKNDSKLSDDRRRLAHCDRIGRGFVPWHQHDHATLGSVEIGGFVELPSWSLMPAAQRAAVLAAHHEFFVEVAGWLPRCRIAEFEAKMVRDGVFELTATIVNDGRLPVLSAMPLKSRRFHPPRLALVLAAGELVAGTANQRARNLEGMGDRQEFRWIVAADKGTTVAVQLATDFAGRDRKEVQL